MKKWILFIATLMSLCSSVARADGLEDGIKAHHKSNYVQAIELLRPIAEEGKAIAQGLLGRMYLRGEGVTQDYQEAAKWFHLAAKQGDAYSQYNLGFSYFYGMGVSQDHVRARMWFNFAARLGVEI